MLHNVSWFQFFLVVTILLLVYYTGLAFTIYRKTLFSIKWNEILIAVQRKIRSNFNGNKDVSDSNSNLVIAELNDLFKKLSHKKTNREEVISSIQSILCQHSSLKGTDSENTINILLTENSQKLCSITLCDAELKMLWNG